MNCCRDKVFHDLACKKSYSLIISSVDRDFDYAVDREVWTKVQDILYDCILNPLILTILD